MMLRPDQPDHLLRSARLDAAGAGMQSRTGDPFDPAAASAADQASSPAAPRLNLLLSSAHWRHEPAFEQLPRLLAPLGIRTLTTASGEEAADVVRTVRVHIAVVDLLIPMQRCGAAESSNRASQPFERISAGPRVLELLRRMDAPPPTVVVRPPQSALRDSARSLIDALRGGAFAVLDQPVPLEAMLEVLRRILRRHYDDAWPEQ